MKSTAGPKQRVGSLIVLVTLAASCGGGDEVADAPIVPTETVDEQTVDTDPLFVRTTGDTAPATGHPAGENDGENDGEPPVGASPDSTTTTTTTTIPLVSDTGVPGIDSDDVFCRSWSQFAGSFRAIGLVSGIRDVDAGLRLEVIASAAVAASIDRMGEHLPAELEPERDILLSDFAGPFGRRAVKAGESLVAAGVGEDDIDRLADAWLTTLADIGIDDPSLDVAIPEGVDGAAVEAAIADFVATTPAIRDDPSLTTFTEIPLTDTYTFANCPDGGTLAGNDDL